MFSATRVILKDPPFAANSLGRAWFDEDDDPPRSTRELLAMRLLCEARGVNLPLNVPPDRTGLIPPRFVDALRRLRDVYERVSPDP